MTYQSEVLADSPVGYWRMEAAGYNEVTGTYNTVVGTLASTYGRVGNGHAFNETQAIDLGGTYNDFTSDNTWSIEAWFKRSAAVSPDYGTIWRRDGNGKAVLLRMHSSDVAQPGQLEFYLAGSTLYSPARYDDGNWHHVVVTVNGVGTNTVKMYVDNVQVAQMNGISVGSMSSGSGSQAIGSGGPNIPAGESWSGALDELAIYPAALSAARVSAHYIAGTPVNVTVDVPTVTATVQAIDATQVSPVTTTVDVGTVTASASAYDLTAVEANTIATLNLSRGQSFLLNGSYFDPATATALYTASGTQSFVLDYELPAGYSNSGSISDTLKLVSHTSGSTGTVRVRAIIAEWVNDSLTHTTSDEYVDVAVTGGTSTIYNVDVSALVAKPNFYGFRVDTVSGSSTFYGYGQLTNAPKLVAKYGPPQPENIEVTVPTVTISADVVQALVEVHNPVAVEVVLDTVSASVQANDADAGTGTTVTVATLTSSLASNDVTVEATVSPTVIVDVSTPVIVGNGLDAQVSVNVAVDADSVAGHTLTANEADVSVQYKVVTDVDTPRIDFDAIRVAVAGDALKNEPVLPTESEDRYFVSTMRTLTSSTVDPNSDFWFRLNETYGNTVYDRASVSGHEPRGTYNGVTLGQHDGPDGRHSVYFNGDAYITQDESSIAGGEIFYGPTSLEFSFRTERATQFLMGGQDAVAEKLATNVTSPYEVWLVDGKLEIRRYSLGTGNTVLNRINLPVNLPLNDGKWHHVIYQASQASSAASQGNSLFQFEIYVDGALKMRRRGDSVSGGGLIPLGMPDRIGGRESDWYGVFGTTVPVIPKSNWFLGDMTEVIFRNARTLSEDEVVDQRDALFGIIPVRPDTARMTLAADEVLVKGNKPRVLVLDFGTRNIMAERISKFPVPNQVNVTRNKMYYATADGTLGSTTEADFIGWGETANPIYQSHIGNDFLVTNKSVFAPNAQGSYRDPITDNIRLIDLTSDLNMDDYDIISIIGFPRNEIMWQTYQGIDDVNAEPMIPVTVQLETLMGQIRDQVISNRMSLMITDPFSAIALGIINNAEYVPTFREVAYLDRRLGAQVGMIDWHSATIDPFNGANPEVPEQLQPNWHSAKQFKSNELSAARYDDTHANLRQRVRYEVEGLTTLVGRYSEWIKTDEIHWWNLNPMSSPPYEFSRRYVEKGLGGLDVDEEFYMVGGGMDEPLVNASEAALLERDRGWIATPPGAVKVGHAVTTFAQSWQATRDLTGDHDGPNPGNDEFDYVDLDNTFGNPYADHAISIAVVPGDVWNGKIVSGKVYVNFTEAFTWWADQQRYENIMMLGTRHPELPPSQTLDIGDEISYANGSSWRVTEEHLRYQFSTLYGSHQDTTVRLPETIGGSGPDWGWSAGGIRSGGGISGGGAQGLVWRWRSSTALESIYVPTMANRAVLWLSKDLDISGNARVAVETAKASVGIVEATVDAQANVTVDLSTTRINIEAHNDIDTPVTDIAVLVGTPEATIQVVGLVEEIVLETASVVLLSDDPLPQPTVVDWSEAIVMTLPRATEILILEDNN